MRYFSDLSSESSSPVDILVGDMDLGRLMRRSFLQLKYCTMASIPFISYLKSTTTVVSDVFNLR